MNIEHRSVVLFVILICGVFFLPEIPSAFQPPQRVWMWERLPGTQVPVQDGSEIGSPIVFSGGITLWEETIKGGLRVAYTPGFEGRNISSRTILAIVLDWGLKDSWGIGVATGQWNEDCFFATDVIPPGGVIPFRNAPRRETRHEGFDTSAPKQDPQAVAYVRYVEFTDGTTFGSDMYSDQLKTTRKFILQHLRSLDRAYRRSGLGGFVEELNAQIEPSEVDNFFQSIRQTSIENGAQAALRRVHFALELARKHQDALDSEID